MTRDQLLRTPRLTARELLASIPSGPGVDERILLAVEAALNHEWWRGYYSAKPETLTPQETAYLQWANRP